MGVIKELSFNPNNVVKIKHKSSLAKGWSKDDVWKTQRNSCNLHRLISFFK
jgi:hypothetical protein